MIVLLDSGPLGLLTNPKPTPLSVECQRWLAALWPKEYRVIVPEIADYEVRRELIRANKTKGIERLNTFKQNLEYLPLTTPMMLKAAEFWAQARRSGLPTADPKALDGDVILAAQATLAATGEDPVVVATTNVGHLSRFVDARRWDAIL